MLSSSSGQTAACAWSYSSIFLCEYEAETRLAAWKVRFRYLSGVTTHTANGCRNTRRPLTTLVAGALPPVVVSTAIILPLSNDLGRVMATSRFRLFTSSSFFPVGVRKACAATAVPAIFVLTSRSPGEKLRCNRSKTRSLALGLPTFQSTMETLGNCEGYPTSCDSPTTIESVKFCRSG